MTEEVLLHKKILVETTISSNLLRKSIIQLRSSYILEICKQYLYIQIRLVARALVQSFGNNPDSGVQIHNTQTNKMKTLATNSYSKRRLKILRCSLRSSSARQVA
jgi:hypothetical protein